MMKKKIKKRVVVIGGGFAGYNAVRCMEKSEKLDIILIDEKNHNVFQPMLYQVATGLIPIVSVAVPIRYLLRKKTYFIQDKVTWIDFSKKQVVTQKKTIDYDYLVICPGSKYQYFNTDWHKYTLSLKTSSDALNIKDHILRNLELAEVEPDDNKKIKLLSFIIIGGGATGVELCGALTDLVTTKFLKHFRHISISDISIEIIEAEDRLLSSFSKKSSEIALNDLLKKGAKVRLSERVLSILPTTVETSKNTYSASTIIWCVSLVSSLKEILTNVNVDASGRIIVNDFLTTNEYPEVYCIGDASHAVDNDNKPYPGLASVAKQQGTYVAKDIIRRENNKKRVVFKFRNYGCMAVISKNNAIAEFKKKIFYGKIGWFLWGFVHIYFLVNFKNKLSVFFNWMLYYFFDRPSSLINLEDNKDDIDK